MLIIAQQLRASCLRLRRRIAYAKTKHVHMYSCYAPPSETPDQFEEFLEALVDHARGRSPKIIAEDFNAWAVEWGSRVSNRRARAVIDAMGMLDLVHHSLTLPLSVKGLLITRTGWPLTS